MLQNAPSSALNLAARTVWGEARNQGRHGWEAVAWVLKNRLDRPGWWGKTLSEICLKPQQFSCWNLVDPNRAQILALPDDAPLLVEIQRTVEAVLDSRVADPTGGATHYHTAGVDPKWDDEMIKTATIGDHLFFRER